MPNGRLFSSLANLVCSVLISGWSMFGQTRIALPRQAQGVDFTGSPTTKPIKMGAALPSTCGTGEMFFNSTAPPGQNLNACYAANLWAVIGGSSGIVGTGGSLPPQTGTAGILESNGAVAGWGNISTGGSGALDCVTVAGTCDIVTAVLPQKPAANIWTGANDFSGGPYVRLVSGPGVPGSGCTTAADVAKVYVRNDARTTSASFYVCSQTGNGTFSWELGQGTSSSAPPANVNGQPAVYNAAGSPLLVHMVTGRSSFISSARAISFIGPAGFTSSTSYVCTANDLSIATSVLVSQNNGGAATFTIQGGAGSDNFNYICVGN